MIKFFEKLLSLIYIRHCFFCKSKKDDNIICSKCYKKIHFLPPAVFREYNGCKIYVCCLYDDIIKRAVKELKYYNNRKSAYIQARLMYEYMRKVNLKRDFLLLPVPVHKNRKKERKYNHMDLIADELSKLTGCRNNKKLLIRVKDTQRQYNLHKKERKENMKDAFEINPKENINKDENLLIIDDITSTGATLEELIKLLKKYGCKNITALVLSTPDIWN